MMRAKTTTIQCAIAGALSICVTVFASLSRPAPAQAVPGASEIREALEDNAGPLQSGSLKLNRAELTGAYRARDFEPVWASAEMAQALETTLGAAGRDGLDPE